MTRFCLCMWSAIHCFLNTYRIVFMVVTRYQAWYCFLFMIFRVCLRHNFPISNCRVSKYPFDKNRNDVLQRKSCETMLCKELSLYSRVASVIGIQINLPRLRRTIKNHNNRNKISTNHMIANSRGKRKLPHVKNVEAVWKRWAYKSVDQLLFSR